MAISFANVHPLHNRNILQLSKQCCPVTTFWPLLDPVLLVQTPSLDLVIKGKMSHISQTGLSLTMYAIAAASYSKCQKSLIRHNSDHGSKGKERYEGRF